MTEVPGPALALLEFGSIAVGIRAGDAMVKQAPVAAVYAGTVHPGKYLVMVAGDTASVDEAVGEGEAVGEPAHLATVLLPDVHPDVIAAVRGVEPEPQGEALGVIETSTVAATIEAADAGVKGAGVVVARIRLADALGGKAYLLFTGPVADVEAAVEIGAARIEGVEGVEAVVIPSFHAEMAANVWAGAEFMPRVSDAAG